MAKSVNLVRRSIRAQEPLIFIIGCCEFPHDLVGVLSTAGYIVTFFEQSSMALSAISLTPPDLLVLEYAASDPNRSQILNRLRQHTSCPILLVSTSIKEVDCVLGLELGADDFVVMPCSTRELLVRIKALFRRVERQYSIDDESLHKRGIRHKNLYLDKERKLLIANFTRVPLTLSEFFILYRMMASPSRVFSRRELALGGSDTSSRAVDMHIANLRRKIMDLDPPFIPLRSVRGVGYRFDL